MARFVIDASATLPWCLRDEETVWTIDLLRRLTEPALTLTQTRAVYTLCEQHHLTFYDAACLELARRLNLQIATLDDGVPGAAPLEGVLMVSTT